MSDWLQLRITVDRDQVEAAEAALLQAGALSLALLDAGDEPVHEPPPAATPLWSRTVIQALYPVTTEPALIIDALAGAGLSDDGLDIKCEGLDDRDWARAWMDRFEPMQFGQSLWICPWHIAPDPAWPLVIRLDPGLAFGSGTHPTTSLCLEWIDGRELHDQTVIDYGCGSGVLALACALKGAKRVIAVDHDPQALAATLDNARRNGIRCIEALSPNAFAALPEDQRRADLVLANILASALVELAPVLRQTVAPGGALVMSGILAGQEPPLLTAYRPELTEAGRKLKEDWLLLHLSRRS